LTTTTRTEGEQAFAFTALRFRKFAEDVEWRLSSLCSTRCKVRFDPKLWKRHGQSPIWLHMKWKDARRRDQLIEALSDGILKPMPSLVFGKDGFLLALPVKPDVSYSEALDAARERARDFYYLTLSPLTVDENWKAWGEFAECL
jgi:hypothetical protein